MFALRRTAKVVRFCSWFRIASILPLPYGVSVENDACAREVTALSGRQDWQIGAVLP
jgi:hypothetical protein